MLMVDFGWKSEEPKVNKSMFSIILNFYCCWRAKGSCLQSRINKTALVHSNHCLKKTTFYTVAHLKIWLYIYSSFVVVMCLIFNDWETLEKESETPPNYLDFTVQNWINTNIVKSSWAPNKKTLWVDWCSLNGLAAAFVPSSKWCSFSCIA